MVRICGTTSLCLLVAACLAAGPHARAQTAATAPRRVTSGISLLPTGAALIDQATAPEVNPAGLAPIRGFELDYLHERDLRFDGVNDAVFAGANLFGLRAGVALQWLRPHGEPSVRKTSWTLAAGSRSFALGGSYNTFVSSGDPDLDRLGTFDLGMQLRPVRFLALGATAHDLGAGSVGGREVPVTWDLGIGVRPLRERVTLGADVLVDDDRGFEDSTVTVTALVEPVNGIVLQAGLGRDLSVDRWLAQLGLTLNAPYLGLSYAGAGGGHFDGVDHLGMVRLSSEEYRSIPVAANRYVVLDPGERLRKPGADFAALLQGGARDPYLELLAYLERVRTARDIDGLVLKISDVGPIGLARVEELRAVVASIRASGKRVVALLLDGGDPEYLLATAAERVYAVPQATFLVNGFSASPTFFAGALDRLGVGVDVARVGEYKNAPDALTRTGMSKEERQVLEAYVGGIFDRYLTTIARARGRDEGALRTVIDKGILSGQGAKEAGLVDELVYPDELQKRLEVASGERVGFVEEPGAPTWPRRWGERPSVAVLNVEGLIAEGKSRSDPFGISRVAGAESILKALERVASDGRIKALVVRVESQGGSGSASDLIWRALRKVRERKPVVASMGDMAASGGYYVAMAADEIFAEPATLTGSIGVFALKPNFQGLLGKVGITNEVIKRGERADLFSLVRPWSPGELAQVQQYVDEFYALFVDRVAESRKLERAKVDAVARGRVWSGAAAKDVGLVDTLGGLSDAIERAKQRAGLVGAEVDVELVRDERGLFDLSFPTTAESRSVLDRALLQVPGVARGLSTLELGERPLAMVPYEVAVE